MHKLMLIGDGTLAATLQQALQAAGVSVVYDTATRVDAVLLAAPTPPQLAQAQALAQAAACPLLLCDPTLDAAGMRAALQGGVDDCWPWLPAAGQLPALLQLALVRHQLGRDQHARLLEAQQQLAERKLIEQAKGLLMKMKGLDEDAAYRQLRARAMQQQQKLAEVAREVITLAQWLQP